VNAIRPFFLFFVSAIRQLFCFCEYHKAAFLIFVLFLTFGVDFSCYNTAFFHVRLP